MDDKLFVVFSMKAVKNGGKSDLEGRPIYDDIPHIRIHVPGDKNSVVEAPVTEEDKVRFASRWEKFQKNMAQSPEGTPLEMWPQLSISQVYEFKALGVMTVEQLAGMSDAHAGKFMGGNELRRRAETFLKVAKDTAEAQRLATLNDELNARLLAQDEMLKKMAAQIEALSQNQKKGGLAGAIDKMMGQQAA
jgi:hypothetical protein